jgi:hypothetical protein
MLNFSAAMIVIEFTAVTVDVTIGSCSGVEIDTLALT